MPERSPVVSVVYKGSMAFFTSWIPAPVSVTQTVSVFLALHTDNALTARMPDLYVREFRLPVRRTSHNNIIRRNWEP